MAIVRSEGFYVNEKSIEPGTYRFVAQHFNHCATAVPTNAAVYSNIIPSVGNFWQRGYFKSNAGNCFV
jgi:hypothetical protein